MSVGTIAALGCAPHSGWAAVVGVSHVGGRLSVVVRERIVFVDPRDAPSKQPYHAVKGLPLDEAARRVASYSATAATMAGDAIEEIAAVLSARGCGVAGLGIVDAAGRKDLGLATILSSHALIHTADGDHFRAAIAAAGVRCGLAVVRVPARELEMRAAAAIGKSATMVQRAIAGQRESVGAPWGADQKAAALIAWLVLATMTKTMHR
jgi:hypothetical protein